MGGCTCPIAILYIGPQMTRRRNDVFLMFYREVDRHLNGAIRHGSGIATGHAPHEHLVRGCAQHCMLTEHRRKGAVLSQCGQYQNE